MLFLFLLFVDYYSLLIVIGLLLVTNLMKFVLSKYKVSIFDANHLFITVVIWFHYSKDGLHLIQ